MNKYSALEKQSKSEFLNDLEKLNISIVITFPRLYDESNHVYENLRIDHRQFQKEEKESNSRLKLVNRRGNRQALCMTTTDLTRVKASQDFGIN